MVCDWNGESLVIHHNYVNTVRISTSYSENVFLSKMNTFVLLLHKLSMQQRPFPWAVRVSIARDLSSGMVSGKSHA